MDRKTDVCIVGAGPAGALLATLLVRRGLDVTLVESAATLGNFFRGEHLNEHGEAVLKAHGLYEDLRARGILPMTRLENWKDGHCYRTVLPDPAIGHLGIHVPQRFLLQSILAPILTSPQFHLYMSTRMRDITYTDGQATGIIVERDHQRFYIESSLIVGADGRYSTVRKKAHIPYDTWEHGYDLLWARIPRPANWEPIIRMALIDGKQLALFTQAEGRIQVGWNIDKGSFPMWRKQPFEPFIIQLKKAFPALASAVDTHITSWRDFVLLDVHSSYANCWGENGVVLLGDAAHTMTPTGAFGLNSALVDAAQLAQLISINGTLTNEDIERFEKMRAHDIHQLQHEQLYEEQHFADQFKVI
ncbi:FAD-dependent monooxygenase [Kurthia massiliensis]|uniref:FAD-dependent monooxygenase n=1 Tax=Kurthia massiliensis TaxID=1033739 RepID=UPI000288DA5E|nr:FAD-dependent monooxygenase [Kurthia massiliensis]